VSSRKTDRDVYKQTKKRKETTPQRLSRAVGVTTALISCKYLQFKWIIFQTPNGHSLFQHLPNKCLFKHLCIAYVTSYNYNENRRKITWKTRLQKKKININIRRTAFTDGFKQQLQHCT